VIKVTLGELLGSLNAAKALFETKLAAKPAYTLAKFLRKAGNHVEDFDKARLALLKQYGEPAEDGQSYIFPDDDKRTEYNKQVETLLVEEVEIEVNPVCLSDLKHVDVSPASIAPVLFLIQEDCE
jgi:hypothetical protein